MDRISVRSSRALHIAEHGLRELAKSRLDTTREIVFQPLGARFAEARQDVARIAALLRKDAFHASDGHFARLILRLEPEVTERLSSIEPRATEARLEEATRAALQRELPGRQGVYLVRFEPSGRGDLEPVAHVHLSSRLSDGGPAPALTREDARRLEARWAQEAERTLGLTRGPLRAVDRERAPERAAALSPEVQRLRQEWSRAWVRLFAVHTDRLAGRATEKQLADAVAHARVARTAWVREMARPDALRDVARRPVLDEIRIKIEGGSRYFVGPLEAQRREVLEVAASRAAGLSDGTERRFAVVSWPAGPDIHAAVYLNERNQPERTPDSLEPERVREALAARLRSEIQRYAPSLDPTAETRAHELRSVQAAVTEREAHREAAAPSRERTPEPTPRAEIVVTLDREDVRAAEAPAPAARADQPDALDRLQHQLDWSSERAFAVRLRVPTGAEQIRSSGLSSEEIAHVLQRAVDRAYPFLEREGVRGNLRYAVHGKALDIRIVVPEKLGWTAEQLRSPQFQQRFITGFHRAMGQVERTRIGPERTPALPGFSRRAEALRQAPQFMRRAEQDPERAAKDLGRAVFDKLSQALPKPFRVMRELSRTVGRFVARGE